MVSESCAKSDDFAITQVPRVVIDETIKEPDAKEILDELDTWAERDLCCIVFFLKPPVVLNKTRATPGIMANQPTPLTYPLGN